MTGPVRVRLAVDVSADDHVGTDIEQCWLDVSNAGGAVGFPFLPVPRVDVRKATRRLGDSAGRRSGAIRAPFGSRTVTIGMRCR